MFDDIEKESIRIEAQSILKRFSERLSGIELDEASVKFSESGMRRAGKDAGAKTGFRDAMFNNSPQKKGDFIIAEKKKW